MISPSSTWSTALMLSGCLVLACGGAGGAGASLAASGGSGTGGTPSGSTAGSSPSADLTQALTLSAAEAPWSAVFVGSASARAHTIEFRNTTSIMLKVRAELAGADAADFLFERALQGDNLPSGQSDWVSVLFAPTASGDKQAKVQFTVSDPNEPSNTQLFSVELRGTASPWSYLGPRGFSAASAGSFLKLSDPSNPGRKGRSDDRSISLAADESGVYIAFKDNSRLNNSADTESGKLTVMKHDGQAWVPLGSPGFSSGDAMWISMAVHHGTPYVAFTDGLDPSAPEEGKATVMKFDGQAWAPLGSERFTPASAAYNSLFIVENGGDPELYLSFQDGAPHLEIDGNDRHCSLSVMRFGGTTWEYVGQPAFSFPEQSGSTTSVAVARGGVFAAYGSGLFRYDDSAGTWSKVTAFSSTSTALTIDQTGDLYLAAAELPNAGKLSVYQYAAGELVPLGAPSFSQGSASFVSLGWHSQNLLAAFTDSGMYGSSVAGGAVVAELLGGEWKVVGSGPASQGAANHVTMASSAGQVYVGFKDEEERAAQSMEGSGKASVLKMR